MSEAPASFSGNCSLRMAGAIPCSQKRQSNRTEGRVMKDSNFAQFCRPVSRRLLVGAVVVAFGLQTAVQNSFSAPGAPSPPPQSIISNEVDVSAPASKVITNLEDVLGLSLEQADRGRPVKALATVTYCHRNGGCCSSGAPSLAPFSRFRPTRHLCGREMLWKSRVQPLRLTATLK